MGSVKPVLCIRNTDHDSLGITAPCLAGEGISVRVVDAWDPTAHWPGLDDVSGVVVFGGPMNVDETDEHPWLVRERELLGEAVDRGTPALGICLGSQLLARALGEPVVRAPVPEIGFTAIELTTEGTSDPLLSAFSSGDRVFQWHRDTYDVPDRATLLATGRRVPVQAFRAGQRAWGIQFHLEVTADEVDRWLATQGPEFESRWGRTVSEIRREIRQLLGAQVARATRLFSRFVSVLPASP
jgi:GMP synthase (glutamine-hydrolysing)